LANLPAGSRLAIFGLADDMADLILSEIEFAGDAERAVLTRLPQLQNAFALTKRVLIGSGLLRLSGHIDSSRVWMFQCSAARRHRAGQGLTTAIVPSSMMNTVPQEKRARTSGRRSLLRGAPHAGHFTREARNCARLFIPRNFLEV